MSENSKVGAIVGACLIVSTIIASITFYSVRSQEDTLSATGSARQKVTSDSVKWSAEFTRAVEAAALSLGYQEMSTDQKKVEAFLKKNGLDALAYTIAPVLMNEEYNYNNPDLPKRYTLRQTLQVNSSEVEKITALAKNSQQLLDQGLIFSTVNLEYFYSKLPELRVNLLGEAIKDARKRAEEIAKAGERKIGALKSASSGVVQVMSVNSVDISDYGSYDTSSVEKEVMVTVKAEFELE